MNFRLDAFLSIHLFLRKRNKVLSVVKFDIFIFMKKMGLSVTFRYASIVNHLI
jgi:hypothetical protein